MNFEVFLEGMSKMVFKGSCNRGKCFLPRAKIKSTEVEERGIPKEPQRVCGSDMWEILII